MSQTVVITRPAGQSAQLSEQLAEIGYAARLYPLLEIVPLPDLCEVRSVLARLQSFALVIFVSPSAIDVSMSCMPESMYWPAETGIGVMGAGSLRRLAQYGISPDQHRIFFPRDAQRNDSETLLSELDLRALRGQRVLILRGQSGRDWLAHTLQQHGIEVVQQPCYQRCAPALTPARHAALLNHLHEGALWWMTSSESARNVLAECAAWGGAELVMKMQQQTVLVPHPHIAHTLTALGFQVIRLIPPGDESLLHALQSCP